jgi:type II secretory ATPase GspE/PulE/Tfp pilus assembly ATPase PilB-like protein
MELDVPAFLVAASLSAVIAQRLVRKLCKCRAEVAASHEYTETLREAAVCDDARRMYVPVGCPDCDNAGYLGRIGIYELLLFDETVAEAVRIGGSPTAIRQAARDNGMRSMQEDGLLKAHTGLTSLEEVTRVVNFKISRPTPVGVERRQRE